MSKDILTALEDRRSYYGIDNSSPISDDEILAIIRHCVKHTPSAYNSQNSKVIVLFKEDHNKLWDIVLGELKKKVAPESFGRTQAKIDSFKSGHATILFFEDMEIVESFQSNFPSYSDNFPLWSTQACGMLQHSIWVALEAFGLGASLQHYNPLIDKGVQETWNVPLTWKLVAQMPFGAPTAEPGEKTFEPIEKRVLVFKS